METKHILLTFHHYRKPKDVGGLRSWHIGSWLAKCGYQVTAIVPGVDTLTGKKSVHLNGKLMSSEAIDGVTVLRVNATKNIRTSKVRRGLYYLSSSLMQVLASLRIKGIDLIVSTSMPLTSVLLSFIQSRIRRVKFAIDVRDLATDAALEMKYFPSNFLVRGALALEGWIYRHADLLIPVSKGMARLLMDKGVDASKIKVIPIGFDGKKVYDCYTEWRRDVRAETGLRGKFLVLYAGTMGHVIDISTVLEAAKCLKTETDICFVFVGGGQRLEEYKETAQRDKLNCMFLGLRPKADIPLFCAQADLCLYPLKGGPLIASLLGNKIFDYLGNGTPTIYSGPDGDIAELISVSGGGVCVPQGDAKALAAAIMELYENPVKAKLMGEKGKHFVRSEYHVEDQMRKFEEAVRQLLKCIRPN